MTTTLALGCPHATEGRDDDLAKDVARFGTRETADCLTVALGEVFEDNMDQNGTVPEVAVPVVKVATEDDLGIGEQSSSLTLACRCRATTSSSTTRYRLQRGAGRQSGRHRGLLLDERRRR